MAHPSVIEFLWPHLSTYNPDCAPYRQPSLQTDMIRFKKFSPRPTPTDPSIPDAPPAPSPAFLCPPPDVIVLPNGREVHESVLTSTLARRHPTCNWIHEARIIQFQQRVPSRIARFFSSDAPRQLPSHATYTAHGAPADEPLTTYDAITCHTNRIHRTAKPMPNSNAHFGFRPHIEFFLFRIDEFLREAPPTREVPTFPENVHTALDSLYDAIITVLNSNLDVDMRAVRTPLITAHRSAATVVQFLYPHLYDAFFNGIQKAYIPDQPPPQFREILHHVRDLQIPPIPLVEPRINTLIACHMIKQDSLDHGAAWIHEFVPDWSHILPDGMPFGIFIYTICNLIIRHQPRHGAVDLLFFVYATHRLVTSHHTYKPPARTDVYDDEYIFPALDGAPSTVEAAHREIAPIIAALRAKTWAQIIAHNTTQSLVYIATLINKLSKKIAILAAWRYPHIYVARLAGIATVERLISPSHTDTQHDTFHNFLFPATIYTISDIISAVRAHDPAASVDPTLMREIAQHIYAPVSPDPSLDTHSHANLFYSSGIDAFIIPVHYSHTESHINALVIDRLTDAPKQPIPISCNFAAAIMGTAPPQPHISDAQQAQLAFIAQIIARHTDVVHHDPTLLSGIDTDPSRIAESAHVLAKSTYLPTWSVSFDAIDAITGVSCRPSGIRKVTVRVNQQTTNLLHMLSTSHRNRHIVLQMFAAHADISLAPCQAPFADPEHNDYETPYPRMAIKLPDTALHPTTDLIRINVEKATDSTQQPFIPQFVSPPTSSSTTEFYRKLVTAVDTYNTSAKLVASFTDLLDIIRDFDYCAPITAHVYSSIFVVGPALKQFFADVYTVPNTLTLPVECDEDLTYTYLQLTVEMAACTRLYPNINVLTPLAHPINCIVKPSRTILTRDRTASWAQHIKLHVASIISPHAPITDLQIYHVTIVLRAAAYIATHTLQYATVTELVRDVVTHLTDNYSDAIYATRAPTFIREYVTTIPYIHAMYT